MKAFGTSLLAAVAAFAFVSQASAAGYEKSIMWGGRTGSVAGISTSYIEGADSLYFNPAGLTKAAPGQDLSLNVSPVWSTFSGPYNNQNTVVDSKSGFSSPVSAIYSNTLNDKWSFGVGGFISGGSKVEYENIDFTPAPDATTGAFSTKTDLRIGEISAGVGYKLSDTVKIGVAYRYVMARADFSFIQRAYTAGPTYLGLLNASLNDLRDQQSAYKIGVQWAPTETTHFGVTYRSEVRLAAAGTIGGQFTKRDQAGGAPSAPVTSAPATANTVFPQAMTVGGDHSFNEMWKGLAEVAWTNYSAVDNISVTTTTTAGAIPVVNPVVTQNWKDQWNARLGAEYGGWSWPVRFGYGFTSQVTASDWARPTFTPPGSSHTLTAGTGQTFELGGQKLEFNGAGEYTFVSGDGTGRAAGDNTISTASSSADIRAGTHKTSSYALHLGLAYNF